MTGAGPKGVGEMYKQDAIRLFYSTDSTALRVAKGVQRCAAIPVGETEMTRSAIWLTSGSPTMKCTVQLFLDLGMGLVILMLLSTLFYNGFFSA